MKQKLNSLIQRFSVNIVSGNWRNHAAPIHVTKEEMLRVFVKELPESSPRRETYLGL